MMDRLADAAGSLPIAVRLVTPDIYFHAQRLTGLRRVIACTE